MANDSKDVELRVRARDYSGKTLDNVAKALGDLEKAQAAQLKSAKAGTSSARELERSYVDIEKAVQALVNQSAVIKLFQEQAKALDEAKKAADAARIAQTAYANSLSGTEKKSKEQIATQKQLANAVKATERQQQGAEDRLQKTTQRMAAYGIAADQVGAAQQRIVAAVSSGNAALDRQAVALGAVDQNIRDAAAAQAAKAAADAEAGKRAKDAMAIEEDWRKQRANMVDVQARMRAADDASAKSGKAMADAMRMSAQQAEASAKGYATLARAVTSVRGNELANQLRSIIDPTAAANRNVQGLEITIDNLTKKVGAVNGPVRDFKTTMQALEAAQKGAVGIAAQIDAYQRQIAVLRTARTEYAAARTAVLDLGRQLQAGGGDAAALGKALTGAQAQLRTVSQAMQQELSVTRDLRTGLREAGVATNDLQASQAKLVNLADRSTKAVNNLEGAFKKHGAAVDKSSKSMFSWMDNGRTTLSFAQRLRGEIIALGAAYVGIQGGIDAAKGALDAFRTAQKINSQLGAAVGNDATAIRTEWDYLMATANRIGISFREAAPAYAKFAIAAKAFGFNLQETRFVFEKFAEASRVAGLSASDFEGVLKAVEQMLSKGTIQAEELRGQLGDRLPGAFVIAATSIGKTTAEFTKMMEAGEVSANTILNIARQLPQSFQGIDQATQNMAAAEQRFQNAAFQFQLAIANNGFADAYTDFLKKLTVLIGSDQGAQLAKSLAGGFSAVIDILKLLADNVDTVKLVFSALIGLAAAKWFFAAATAVGTFFTAMAGLLSLLKTVIGSLTLAGSIFTSMGGAAIGTAGALGVLRVGIMALIRMIPGLGALVTGLLLAKAAYDALSGARDKALRQSEGAGGLTKGPMAQGKVTDMVVPVVGATADPGTGGTSSARAAAAAAKEAEANQKKLDKALKSARAKGAKEQLDARGDLIKEEYNLKRDAVKREITTEVERNAALATIDKQEKQALSIDQIKYNNENAKAGEAAGEKRVQLQEDIKNQLLAIQDKLAKESDKLDKNSTFEERRASRIAAITHEYDKLRKTISKLAPLDKAGADAATTRLNAYTKELQAQEDIKVTGEEIKKLEKEMTDQQTLREQSLQQIKALYDAGSISQSDFLLRTADATRKGDLAVVEAAANLQKFADAAVAANKGVISLTDQSEIKTKTTLATANSAGTENKINDEANKAQEQTINNLIAKRTAAENLFKSQFELRLITEDQYAAKVNANADLYNGKIAEQVNLFKTQLETQRAQGLLEGTLNVERLAALDAQIAKMTQLSVETTNAAKQADTFQLNLNKFVSSGIDSALDSLTAELTKMAEGAQNFETALKNMGTATLKFVAQFLLEIGKAIAKQLILNAIAGMGGAFGAAGKAAGGVASVLHAGGTVGSTGGRSRRVSPSYFANAPKFHSGGLPGLASDEVPAILQKGEQVLSKDDPNNILNQVGQSSGAPTTIRQVLVDDRSRVPEAMASAEGDRVIVSYLQRNAATVKQIIG